MHLIKTIVMATGLAALASAAPATSDAAIAGALCPQLKQRNIDSSLSAADARDALVKRACAGFNWFGAANEADEGLTKRLCPQKRDVDELVKRACAGFNWFGAANEADEGLAKRVCPQHKKREVEVEARDADALVKRACAGFNWFGAANEADEGLAKRLCPQKRDVDELVKRACAGFNWFGAANEAQ
ncbi:predicted protein [Uncinocarpus reesii 1704]|uniref:Secreted protein n=1 Tax=Uncinocarpus reesii (strain UAMH 1704) TaxID=336963 RepID=C4JWM3_UNCRE|nr:uncharacterized protein UREG_06965 [Uncinocarpus reesii 1704]EEP82100.1 predicted protein [Uncinocarpus reesii 1704]